MRDRQRYPDVSRAAPSLRFQRQCVDQCAVQRRFSEPVEAGLGEHRGQGRVGRDGVRNGGVRRPTQTATFTPSSAGYSTTYTIP